MISIIGTVWNKAGFNEIAPHDADPRFVSHISDHGGDMDVSEESADCGYPYAEVEAGRTAQICPRCADLNADQPWIQRIR